MGGKSSRVQPETQHHSPRAPASSSRALAQWTVLPPPSSTLWIKQQSIEAFQEPTQKRYPGKGQVPQENVGGRVGVGIRCQDNVQVTTPAADGRWTLCPQTRPPDKVEGGHFPREILLPPQGHRSCSQHAPCLHSVKGPTPEPGTSSQSGAEKGLWGMRTLGKVRSHQEGKSLTF